MSFVAKFLKSVVVEWTFSSSERTQRQVEKSMTGVKTAKLSCEEQKINLEKKITKELLLTKQCKKKGDIEMAKSHLKLLKKYKTWRQLYIKQTGILEDLELQISWNLHNSDVYESIKETAITMSVLNKKIPESAVESTVDKLEEQISMANDTFANIDQLINIQMPDSQVDINEDDLEKELEELLIEDEIEERVEKLKEGDKQEINMPKVPSTALDRDDLNKNQTNEELKKLKISLLI